MELARTSGCMHLCVWQCIILDGYQLTAASSSHAYNHQRERAREGGRKTFQATGTGLIGETHTRGLRPANQPKCHTPLYLRVTCVRLAVRRRGRWPKVVFAMCSQRVLGQGSRKFTQSRMSNRVDLGSVLQPLQPIYIITILFCLMLPLSTNLALFEQDSQGQARLSCLV